MDVPSLAVAEALFPGASTPLCEIQLNQRTFSDGELVSADVFRIANPGADPVATEWKVWLEIPTLGPVALIRVGADGTFVLPAGF